MITVGLTGGIGAGKSLVAHIFKVLGVPVFESDLEGRKILETKEVILQIKNNFGTQVVVSNRVDRAKLAAIVFGNEEKLKVLNSIVHPAVRKRFEEWKYANRSARYVVNEAAILFESGLYKQVDYSVNICAPQPTRIERVMKRDGSSELMVLDRIKNQLSDDERRALATWTIVNDGVQAILPQVLRVDTEIKNKIV